MQFTNSIVIFLEENIKTKNPRNLLIFGWLTALAVLQPAIGLIRYVNRLPDDWIGIIIYTITLSGFIAASIGYLFKHRK